MNVQSKVFKNKNPEFTRSLFSHYVRQTRPEQCKLQLAPAPAAPAPRTPVAPAGLTLFGPGGRSGAIK
ncbi:hypothetical protein JYU34_020762 [Plutella xylostella]|uniref:Uncharacterized protein n=1 Tax=Plutella xylostella TaxID=51655 RepID=A0ABQ7PRW1_PLUXY|nr:hypothetical protein JYU34_020762 [Plutella xylostella]